jgi:hypothetical protein
LVREQEDEMTAISDLVRAAAAEIDFDKFRKRNRHLGFDDLYEKYRKAVDAKILKRTGARSFAELHEWIVEERGALQAKAVEEFAEADCALDIANLLKSTGAQSLRDLIARGDKGKSKTRKEN